MASRSAFLNALQFVSAIWFGKPHFGLVVSGPTASRNNGKYNEAGSQQLEVFATSLFPFQKATLPRREGKSLVYRVSLSSLKSSTLPLLL
jgi:hypothetical protein